MVLDPIFGITSCFLYYSRGLEEGGPLHVSALPPFVISILPSVVEVVHSNNGTGFFLARLFSLFFIGLGSDFQAHARAEE